MNITRFNIIMAGTASLALGACSKVENDTA
jgi:hypothetical protein